MVKELRYYQKETKDNIFLNLAKNINTQLVVLPTGTGKTFTAINAINEFKKILWITHTEELIEQSSMAMLADFFDHSIIDIVNSKGGLLELLRQGKSIFTSQDLPENFFDVLGVVKADLFNINAKFTVGSIQTLVRRLDRLPKDHFDCIVIDECHYAIANTWTKTIEHFTPKLRLGLTATPYRSDNMPLTYLFEKIVYEYDILTAINDGYLCEINAIRIKSNINLDTVRTTAGELNAKDLAIVNTKERNDLIVEKYFEHAKGRPFIAFCVDVQHAKDLLDSFLVAGVKADIVVGDEEVTSDRRGTIQRFKQGELDGLTNVMVLTAGFDHPETACVIMACPTKSKSKFVQCVGRGLRLKKNFKDMILLDIVDVTHKHSLINSFTLDKGKRFEDKIFLTKEQKMDLIAKRDAPKQEHKFVSKTQKDEFVNLMLLPEIKIYDSPKMKEPASEKQLAIVKSLGYDIVNNEYTKAMASAIISNMPAKNWQIDYLKKNGYDTTGEVTYAQYKKVYEEIQSKSNNQTLNKIMPFSGL